MAKKENNIPTIIEKVKEEQGVTLDKDLSVE